jgi:hypothetical protein
MMVMPKPPVEVMTPAGRGKAHVWYDDVVVVSTDDGRLHLFNEEWVTPVDGPVSPSKPTENQGAFCSQSESKPEFRRGDLVRPRGSRIAYRVTDVGDALISAVTEHGGRASGPPDRFEKVDTPLPSIGVGDMVRPRRSGVPGVDYRVIDMSFDNQWVKAMSTSGNTVDGPISEFDKVEPTTLWSNESKALPSIEVGDWVRAKGSRNDAAYWPVREILPGDKVALEGPNGERYVNEVGILEIVRKADKPKDKFKQGDLVTGYPPNMVYEIVKPLGDGVYLAHQNGRQVHLEESRIQSAEDSLRATPPVPLKCPGHRIEYGRCIICGVSLAAIQMAKEEYWDNSPDAVKHMSGVPVGYDPRPNPYLSDPALANAMIGAPKNARPMPKWFVDIYTAAMLNGTEPIKVSVGEHEQVVSREDFRTSFE